MVEGRPKSYIHQKTHVSWKRWKREQAEEGLEYVKIGSKGGKSVGDWMAPDDWLFPPYRTDTVKKITDLHAEAQSKAKILKELEEKINEAKSQIPKSQPLLKDTPPKDSLPGDQDEPTPVLEGEQAMPDILDLKDVTDVKDLVHKLELMNEKLDRRFGDEARETQRREAEIKEEVSEVTQGFQELSALLTGFVKQSENGHTTTASKLEEHERILGGVGQQLGKMPKVEEIQAAVSDNLLESLNTRLSELPNRGEVKNMVQECITDPESGVCKILADQLGALKPTDEDEEEAAEEHDHTEEEDGPIHTTAEDFLNCPECRPKFAQAILANEDFQTNLLGSLSTDQAKRLVDNLMAAGVSIKAIPPVSKGREVF